MKHKNEDSERSSEKQKKSSLNFDVTPILILLAIVIVLVLFYYLGTNNDAVLHFVHAIGGGYLILFPVVMWISQSSYQIGLLKLSFQSDNIKIDSLYALSGAVLLYFLMALSNLYSNTSGKVDEKGASLVLLIIVAGLIGPIIEEFFFRKMIYSFIKKYSNVILALLGSSILFALAHFPFSPIEGFLYILSGMVLGFLYEKTGNLFAPIIAHSIGNIMALFIVI